MFGLLARDGYQLVDEPEGTDFVLVNTCGFIEPARQESMAAIDQMLQLKRRGQTGGVIVCGCLAERQRQALLQARPEIDGLVGVFAREEITRVAERLGEPRHEQQTVFRPAPVRPLPEDHRLRVTPPHFAYLKISEGCDRRCTFCSIPLMRGRHVSKPIEQVVDEARQLAAGGVRELILVAQDTTYYGIDLYGAPQLSQLLRQLEQIPQLQWIRLMYLYPQYVSDELIDTIAGSEKILPYLDLPLQHINDTMLRRMSRRVTRRQTEALLQRLRRRIPQLALRTTLIVGFPGETDEQFAELAEFVQQQRFERLGVFTYWLEPDTPSATMPDQVPEKIKHQRRDRLMTLQQQIAFEHNRAQIGRQTDCILDRAVDTKRNVWLGRTYADAPEIDTVVYVTGGPQPLRAGLIVPCEIVATKDYDLVAVAVGPPRR